MQLLQHLHRFQDSFILLSTAALMLLLVTHFVVLRCFKQFPVSPLSVSVVMAFALYVAECLPQYHPNIWVLKLFMLQTTVLWIYSSFSLLNDFFLTESRGKQSDRFGLSAWIICTAFVAIMIGRISPLQHGVILLLVIFAVLLWFKYAVMVCRAFVYHIKNNFNEYVSASLLLGAGATACLAWMDYMIFHERVPNLLYQSFVVLACLLYVFIFAMWLSHYFRGKMRHLLASWNAENSLIFGISALIGMVSLTTQSHEWLVDAIWFWSMLWCIIITSIDIGHLCVHIAKRGINKKILSYDVRHWLRIFSYCMLYVFSWYYYFEHYSDDLFPVVIAEHGLNFISAIFVAQIIYTCLADWLVPHDKPSDTE